MYKIIHRTDGVIAKFKTEMDLIKFIKNEHWNYNGWQLNKIYHVNCLDTEYCHNWNDFYWIHYDQRLGYIPKKKVYFTLIIKDHWDRIINIPDFIRKIESVILPERVYRGSGGYDNSTGYKLWKKRCPAFLQDFYYRNMRTANEMRQACDPMHKPYVRPRRRPHFLNSWDIEASIFMDSSWKQLKIQKQWMEKLT